MTAQHFVRLVYGVLCLVDNAHGAYLKFLSPSMPPLDLGADMCCDSAHKTLPVLTGGGYLHIASDDRYSFSQNAVNAMAIFGSTSPSYLILQSLDLCNKYIDEKIRDEIKICTTKCDEIKKTMQNKGIPNLADEPLKITADFRGFDFDFKSYFREYGIEFEYADDDFVVFMLSPQNSNKDFDILKKAFENLEIEKSAHTENIVFEKAERVLSIRQAVFSESEDINVENSLGRICANPTVSCPPAIPITVSGERITQKHIELFRKNNIDKINVIK